MLNYRLRLFLFSVRLLIIEDSATPSPDRTLTVPAVAFINTVDLVLELEHNQSRDSYWMDGDRNIGQFRRLDSITHRHESKTQLNLLIAKEEIAAVKY